MKCSIQGGEAELNGTLHLSPNENICSIVRMINIHYLFYITCTKIQNFLNKFTRKPTEKQFWLKQTHTLRLLHLPRVEFRTSSFLLVSF